ncbi:MAG: VanW family protein [Oscillospiraceae bacterium]|nr:VanW family protein [Oscillospiraceae bacterium]
MNMENEHDLESILREFSSEGTDRPEEKEETDLRMEDTAEVEKSSSPKDEDLPEEPAEGPAEPMISVEEEDAEESADMEDELPQFFDDDEEYEYRLAKKKRRRWILPFCVVLFIILLVVGGVTYMAYRVSQSDTILPNVYVAGIDLGGMSRKEAEDMLESCNWDKSISGALEVRLPMDVSASIDYTVAGLRLTAATAINDAEAYGREGNMYERLYAYVNALIMPHDVADDRTFEINEEYVDQILDQAVAKFDELTADSAYKIDREKEQFIVLKGAGEIRIDRDALKKKVMDALKANEEAVIYRIGDVQLTMPDFEAVRAEVYSEAVDAYYDRENDTVVDEVIGVDFDVETAARIWNAAEPLTYVTVPIEATYAEIKGEDLRAVLFRDVLGEFTTSFAGSIPNRCSNINLAVSTIDGIILLPGETFSYNQTLGERTEEAGYLLAGAYNDGEVIEAIGGGICQVSSTLCVAVRYANLEYHRACHQFRVNYMDAGLDATVDWPNRDFTFKNTRDYPVKIHAFCDNDALTVTIQIIGTDVDGSYIEIVNTYYSAFTWGQYNPGETEHSEEYLNTWIGDIYKSEGKHYDKDGNLLEIIYTQENDYCMYLRHDVVMPEDYYTPPAETEGDVG